MKTIKWFTDTETTGLLKQLEQILSFSIVLEQDAETIQAYEKTIFLKENILPNPSALIVNKINPFSSEWKNSSITEYEAYLHLKSVFTGYLNKGYRIVMIAYNLEFDDIMYQDLFKRYGDNLDNYITIKFDPLITVKKLIEQGKLVTKEIQTTYSKSYMTSKLEEVYKALGYDSSSFKAHTALDDTLMLQMVTHGIYYLALDKKLDELNANPEQYTVGQIVQVISEDKKIGLYKKYFKILYNDIENKKLIVLDEQMAMASSAIAGVRVAEYSEILDEGVVDFKDKERIENYYNNHQSVIIESTNNLIGKKEKKVTVVNKINEIEQLVEKMNSSENRKKAFKELSQEELELFEMAENYNAGKNQKIWSKEIFGANYLTKKESLKLMDDLILELDPLGFYKLINHEEEILKTEKKTELQEKILEISNLAKDSEELKKINKMIPSVSKFKNNKHPASLLEEFENVKAEVFQSSDKFKKDLIADLLQYYKKKAPDVFEQVSLPSFKLDLSALLKKK